MSTEKELHVTSVDRVDGTAVLVEFSDGTIATFTTAQLVAIAPNRERSDKGAPENGVE